MTRPPGSKSTGTPRASKRPKLQQAAVIAVRRRETDVEVCLIRRKGTIDWGIPKGLVDPGFTPEQTALNEAEEEAGLGGRLVGDALGTYQYKKWGTTLVVAVFLMQVLEEQEVWPERGFRERRWVARAEAAALLADHPVQPLFALLGGRIDAGIE
jgi:phosphohistidine phosphatase